MRMVLWAIPTGVNSLGFSITPGVAGATRQKP